MENNKYITVTQLTRYLKYKLENDSNLGLIFLKGEISNFKNHTRGHFYFTLKDDNARISAMMFGTYAEKIKFVPKDGMKVMVVGRIGVYESTGSYQIYVSEMIEDGVGNLYIAFEQLKKKLEQEGLFKQEYKKPIPKIPNRIGIITAPTGAAIKDILSTIKRRFPLCETILFPSLVQGELAKNDIVKNLELADTYNLDVIILGRGGGSIEDLWPFNEEMVARAIFKAKTPIISAVGHEIDFTISDFVADLRAPTPTGAAEMAVPNKVDLINYLEQIKIRLNKALNHKLSFYEEVLNRLKNSFVLKNPISIYEIKEQNFDHLYERLLLVMKNIIKTNSERLNLLKNSYVLTNPKLLYMEKAYNYNDLINRLRKSIRLNLDFNVNLYINLLGKIEVLNPITTIKRGYSIVRMNNKSINSINDVKTGDRVNIEISDGNINAIIE